jgi:hypothetical protein
MITPKKGNSVRITDKDGEQQKKRFDGMISPVNIIPQKNVICIRTFTTNTEKLLEIEKLTVNVAADDRWGGKTEKERLLGENLGHLERKPDEIWIGYLADKTGRRWTGALQLGRIMSTFWSWDRRIAGGSVIGLEKFLIVSC